MEYNWREILRKKRELAGLTLRQVGNALGYDTASKANQAVFELEKKNRLMTKAQFVNWCKLLRLDSEAQEWMTEFKPDDLPLEAMTFPKLEDPIPEEAQVQEVVTPEVESLPEPIPVVKQNQEVNTPEVSDLTVLKIKGEAKLAFLEQLITDAKAALPEYNRLWELIKAADEAKPKIFKIRQQMKNLEESIVNL